MFAHLYIHMLSDVVVVCPVAVPPNIRKRERMREMNELEYE